MGGVDQFQDDMPLPIIEGGLRGVAGHMDRLEHMIFLGKFSQHPMAGWGHKQRSEIVMEPPLSSAIRCQVR